MAKWIKTFVLIVALGSNVLGGSPMHVGERESGMAECCKTARSHGDSPTMMAARLCCAVNCPQPAPTGQSGNFSVSPLLVISTHPSDLNPPMVVPPSNLRLRLTQTSSQDSNPTYIRHLALLI